MHLAGWTRFRGSGPINNEKERIFDSALFDLAEYFRRFQKGRYFYLNHSETKLIVFAGIPESEMLSGIPAFLLLKKGTGDFINKEWKIMCDSQKGRWSEYG